MIMKATKMFKIGEYAIGGIIKVDVKDDSLTIRALDYNSKECIQEHSFPDALYAGHGVMDLLYELTSSYYAGKVFDWIKTKINIIF